MAAPDWLCPCDWCERNRQTERARLPDPGPAQVVNTLDGEAWERIRQDILEYTEARVRRAFVRERFPVVDYLDYRLDIPMRVDYGLAPLAYRMAWTRPRPQYTDAAAAKAEDLLDRFLSVAQKMTWVQRGIIDELAPPDPPPVPLLRRSRMWRSRREPLPVREPNWHPLDRPEPQQVQRTRMPRFRILHDRRAVGELSKVRVYGWCTRREDWMRLCVYLGNPAWTDASAEALPPADRALGFLLCIRKRPWYFDRLAVRTGEYGCPVPA